MTPEQYFQGLNRSTTAFKGYMNNVWPKRVGEIAIRFINGNFRAQGWQGESFQPWKQLKKPRPDGSILRKTGHLASSFYFNTSPGKTVIRTNVPYARVHNEGFTGQVTVKPGLRRINTLKGVKNVAVKGFTRNMNVPKRQFMPTNYYDSPVFYEAVKAETIMGIKNIFDNIK